MHKRGHRGIAFLILAPLLYTLLPDRPLLALLSMGVLVTERIPDKDQGISWIEHRKTSHSVTAAALIGGLCAVLGWALGRYVTPTVTGWLSAPAADGSAAFWGSRIAVLDAPTFAAIGFAVGAGGIVVHLLGDFITTQGLQPFLPFSSRRYNPSPMYSSNKIANNGLFAVGMIAVVASLASVFGLL